MTRIDPASCFRALVRPRASAPDSGEVLPLDDLAAELLQRRNCRLIEIAGGPGAGKTTALRHLAATLPAAADAVFLDDPEPAEIAVFAQQRVVFTGRESVPADVTLQLAPWSEDDLIEWLLAAAPQRCADVMARVHAAADKAELLGNPTLWHVVIDQFLDDVSLTTIREAVVGWLAKLLKNPKERRLAADFSLAILLREPVEALRAFERLCPDNIPRDRYRPLRHPFVQRLLAAQRLATLIRSGGSCPALHKSLPEALVRELALWVRSDPALGDALLSVIRSLHWRRHAQAATILFAAHSAWRPEQRKVAWLAGGSFPQAQWSGLQLPDKEASQTSDLSETKLTGVNLTHAVLEGVWLRKAVLTRARLDKSSLIRVDAVEADLSGANLTAANAAYAHLRQANLQGAWCDDADLTGADLEGADLRQASFRGATLQHAILRGCNVEGASFCGANLREAVLSHLVLREAELQNACFEKADLSHCDLEGVLLPSANFFHANLTGAYLTGSQLPAADFRRARLCGAGLADIQWEGADLRGADLRGCTFHMGSSRSGLVGSPYPGHGSKTGFYTDDYNDQDFKAPEEIRKANLCGADLRGAILDGVDFYLVDLRGALFDAAYAEHLSQCGAILYDRCT